MFLHEATNFVARRWIFSIIILSFLYKGDQIGVAYSTWGLTIDLYKFKNISSSMNVNVLKIIPRFLLAMFTLEFI